MLILQYFAMIMICEPQLLTSGREVHVDVRRWVKSTLDPAFNEFG